jgi:cation/acetate symporter
MPHLTDKQEMMFARIAMSGAIIVATWLGLNPPGFAAQTVALAFGMAAATLFPCIVQGIFNKRINSKGAIAGMLAGAFVTVGYIFMYLGWFFIPGTNTFPNTPEHWILGISPLSCGVIGAIANLIVANLVSLATEKPSAEIQDLVRRVRYPTPVSAKT